MSQQCHEQLNNKVMTMRKKIIIKRMYKTNKKNHVRRSGEQMIIVTWVMIKYVYHAPRNYHGQVFERGAGGS